MVALTNLTVPATQYLGLPPLFPAIEVIAANSKLEPVQCSSTIHTTRSRTSGERCSLSSSQLLLTDRSLWRTRDASNHRLGIKRAIVTEVSIDRVSPACVTIRPHCLKMGCLRGGAVPDIECCISPQLNEAIIAMSPADTSQFCFLMTRRNKPSTNERFGNFFRKACTAAGLPHCSAHGLRKATLRRMAELEMANKTMESVSGQTRDDTLAGYTATANRRTLADSAIDTLSKWEMSNLGSAVRHQTANNY